MSPDAAAQEAGTNVLHGGGNAVDAVLAAMLAGAICASPASLLGSGVVLVAGAGVGAYWIDGRARVPGLGVRRVHAPDDPPRAWSVALPGLLEGVLTAHNRFGRAGLGSLTRAAVSAAREHDPGNAVRARSTLVEMLPHSGLDALARLGIRQAIRECASPSAGGLITREDLLAFLPVVEPLTVLSVGSEDVLVVPVTLPPRFAPPPPPDVPVAVAVAGDKEGVMACAVWAIADEAFALQGETGLSMAALSNSPMSGVTRRKPGSAVPLRVSAAILRSAGRPRGACAVAGEGDVDALCLRQVAARLEQPGVAFAAPAPTCAHGMVSWVLLEPGGNWRGSNEVHDRG